MGCLFCVGAIYPDFTIHQKAKIQIRDLNKVTCMNYFDPNLSKPVRILSLRMSTPRIKYQLPNNSQVSTPKYQFPYCQLSKARHEFTTQQL